MKAYSIIVHGEPKGQPRPKAFVRGGHAAVYNPSTAEGWKNAIAIGAKEIGVVGLMLNGPIKVSLKCGFKRPKSHYRTGKRAGELRDDAPDWHISKPDSDNVFKAAADALTHLGVWKDDSQVADIRVRKYYSNQNPISTITIEQMEDTE